VNNSWWRNAVIYQVYPRSFLDTNGDGDGDLPGVIERLPYLKSLGIDAVWLSPFYPTPNKDGGYDVSDPRGVDPRFGTLTDVQKLIESAHELGLRIIFDVVPNHFSSDHPWFKSALSSPPGSPERARFHFFDGRGASGDEPPNNWNSLFGGPAWTRIAESDGSFGQWYLHLFDASQPDLNWANPEVSLDFEKTLRFWLDRGVDGFRIDVAHGLAKDQILVDHRDPKSLSQALRLDFVGMTQESRAGLLRDVPFFDREGVHDIYRAWRKLFDSYDGDRMSVAEAWVYPSSRAARYVRPDELHQIFNFDFLMIDWNSDVIREAIERTLSEVAAVGAPATWVLCNHDSPRIVTRLKDANRARALALLTHSLPGSIYIYQGEELGLEDGSISDEARQDPMFFRTHGIDKGRDGCRVPLPWDAAMPNFGFSSQDPWLPQPAQWAKQSVNSQEVDPESFLSFYRKSLALRKSHPALNHETPIIWHHAPKGVLHFEREWGLVVVVNTTDYKVEIEVSATSNILHISRSGVHLANGHLKLPANSTVWLES